MPGSCLNKPENENDTEMVREDTNHGNVMVMENAREMGMNN